MKFSTRSSYGLRAVAHLASQKQGKSLSLSNIAKFENISLKYLERIFAGLKKAGLIESEKGASGGYKLAKNASEISVFDVIEALEGPEQSFHCVAGKEKIYCSQDCRCSATRILIDIQTAINSTLKNIKLNNI